MDQSLKKIFKSFFLFFLFLNSLNLDSADFFSPFSSGEPVNSVLTKIQADSLFFYREPQVIMSVPVIVNNEVFYEVDKKVRALAVSGTYYIEKSFFYFTDEKLSSMTVNFSPKLVTYYELFLKLKEKYGEPSKIEGPRLVEWQYDGTLIRLERPTVLKYLDLENIKSLKEAHEKTKGDELNAKNSVLDRL